MFKDGIPVSWFDFVVIVMVVVGFIRGRKRGISQELLDLFMWIGIVAAGAAAYKEGGRWLGSYLRLPLMWAHIVAYLGASALVVFLFMWLKDTFKDKLASSDMFGSLEYPLGMLSGMIRFLLMLIMVLALLNARLYTKQDLASMKAYQNEAFSGIEFPTIGEIQLDVFTKSLSGKTLKTHAPFVLIDSTSPSAKAASATENQRKSKESDMDRIINNK